MKILLKFILSLGIIYWLVKSDRLDFSLIEKSLQFPWALIGCTLLIIIQDLIACFRWKILMQMEACKKISFLHYIKINWIGLFFNSILPGAVTGDLVKMFYARELDATCSKTFVFTTIILDRIIGLCGIFLILGGFSIFTYHQIQVDFPKIVPFLQFNFLLLAGVILFLFLLFLPPHHQKKIALTLLKLPLTGEKTNRFLMQGVSISSRKKTILTTLLLSIIAQVFAITALWIIIHPFINNSIPFHYAFTLFPLGLIMIAIPISPAGLGVGHAIFDVLFRYFSVENGASLFNLYFIVVVSLHLLGGIPYIFSKKKPAMNQNSVKQF